MDLHLIELAKELRDAGERGQKLGLNGDETAFYDALAANESAKEVLGDEKLAIIARGRNYHPATTYSGSVLTFPEM